MIQKKKLVSARNQLSRDGLTCSNCHRFACKECVTAFVIKAGKHGKKDRWCLEVKQYLVDGNAPEMFIGHCCELGSDSEKEKSFKKKKKSCGDMRYDGYLHIPDFGVLISAKFDCTDVHGFIECAEAKKKEVKGDTSEDVQYKTHFGPLAHCVIGEIASRRYYKNNVKAEGTRGDDLGIFTVNVGSVEDGN